MKKNTTADRESSHAARIAEHMRASTECYEDVLRTSLGLAQGELTDAEHKVAKRRARLCLEAFNALVVK
jgi:hypothetical protein